MRWSSTIGIVEIQCLGPNIILGLGCSRGASHCDPFVDKGCGQPVDALPNMCASRYLSFHPKCRHDRKANCGQTPVRVRPRCRQVLVQVSRALVEIRLSEPPTNDDECNHLRYFRLGDDGDDVNEIDTLSACGTPSTLRVYMY